MLLNFFAASKAELSPNVTQELINHLSQFTAGQMMYLLKQTFGRIAGLAVTGAGDLDVPERATAGLLPFLGDGSGLLDGLLLIFVSGFIVGGVSL